MSDAYLALTHDRSSLHVHVQNLHGVAIAGKTVVLLNSEPNLHVPSTMFPYTQKNDTEEAPA